MADTNATGAAGTPEIKNKSVQPPGIIPKNAQTWAMAAIAIVMVSVIAFSGTPSPKKTTDTISRANAVVDPNQRRIQDYRQEIAEQTRKLAEEQARLENAKREFTSLATPPADPNRMSAFPSPMYGATPAMVNGGPQPPPTTKRAIESEKERREYTSLFASNVALTFRKDGGRGDAATPDVSGTAAGAPATQSLASSPAANSARVTTPAPAPVKIASGESSLARPEPKPSKPESKVSKADNGTKHQIYEGTVLEAVLTNRLAGDFSGPVNCMLTTNVYSHDHQTLLIPQGARVLGEANKVSSFGQQRLAVSFHRIIMPDGFSLSLDDFKGLNQIGETGLRDKVNHHYLAIFGTSLAIGAIAGLAQANTQYGFSTSGLDA
ncbi:MAG: hypothetical protein JO022_19080, partial [Acidobacteriaceae bacterium]|nr:hypothetical protein [Acidobacteriaceae bacterium]